MAEALQTGAALLASEQLGVARWCFDTTLAYAKERKQFGRTIGSYQAIKHRLADLWIEVNSVAPVARYAADTCARRDNDATIAAAVMIVVFALRLRREQTASAAMALFRYSITYLSLLFVAMAGDVLIRFH